MMGTRCKVLAAGVGIAVLLFCAAQAGLAYDPPAGGWTYIYTGDDATAGAGAYTSLDGTWDHDNSSDEWDGSTIGAGNPGGASIIDGSYLRLQETGDPRDHGFSDPGSIRKITFGHSVTTDVGASGDAALDDGITISFRARVATGAPLDDVHPDGGGTITAWPAGGKGYPVFSDGKANFAVRQSSGDKIIGFSLALASDSDALSEAGLVMNNLNGNSPNNNIDTGEGGTLNQLVLDTTQWHEYWITIVDDPSDTGTHLVQVYVDGSLTPTEFTVTAGQGNDYDDSYISMGIGATGDYGAYDIDFFAYTLGVVAPPEPAPTEPELVGAFTFGSRNLDCPVGNDPSVGYTMVHHAGNDCDSHNALAYAYDDPADDPDLGPNPYGFVVVSPEDPDGNCGNQFVVDTYGNFDNSPNNRGKVGDDCPEQIYDSFIGIKQPKQPCGETIVGNAVDPCTPGTMVVWRDNNSDGTIDELDAEPYVPWGMTFRVDVPDGFYRFVAVFGDIDNPHAHHVIAEDGGGDLPPADGSGWLLGNHVELIHNFSQRRAGGDLHMAAVGFEDKLPPMNWDSSNADPILHYFNSQGLESPCPNSPVLEVTDGHVRIHILQGSTTADESDQKDDGGDIVLLELWRVPDGTINPDPVAVTVNRTIAEETYVPGGSVNVTLDVSGVPGPTLIAETIPAGWTVTSPGGGTFDGTTLTFEAVADGQIQYTLQASNDCVPTVHISGTVDPGDLGCFTTVEGESSLDLNSGLEVTFSRSIAGSRAYLPGDQLIVTLTSTSEVWAQTTVTEVIPPEFSVVDNGGGTEVGDTLSFTVPAQPFVASGLTVTRVPADTGNPAPEVADGTLVDGALCFVDRTHVWAEVAGSPVEGAEYIKVSNNDRTADPYNLEVQATVDGTLYLMIDNRVGDPSDGGTPPVLETNMQWVIDQGFTDTGSDIGIDESDDGDIDQHFSVFSKVLPANTLEVLREQKQSLNNYGVAFVADANLPSTAMYTIEAVGCARTALVGESLPDGGCPTQVAGDAELGCAPFVCDPAPEDPAAELVGAFAFGSRNLTCDTLSQPGTAYTMIHHAANNCDAHNALAYDNEAGYGFVVIDPGNDGRNCGAQFGPFDDSPNGRDAFADECGEELYDSFIGFKNYTNDCNATTIGDPNTPCDAVLPAEGGIFRVDVPPGEYRFIAILGEATNPHAHRLLAENGGSGGPPDISRDHVVLVNNFDQAQFDHGEVSTGDRGNGVYARVGFNCRIPPLGDGLAPDPQFVNFGPDGLPTGPGGDGVYGTLDDPPPESPSLLVTDGYVRFHLLQGNANNGPGGEADPNGTDVVILEVWKVADLGPKQIAGDCNQDGIADISDVICDIGILFTGFNLLDRTIPEPPCTTDEGNILIGDVNGDSAFDVSDVVYLANFLFLGGSPPVKGTECFATPLGYGCPGNTACD